MNREEEARIAIEILKKIKEECKGKDCLDCKLYNKEADIYEVPPCILTGYDELCPEDWNEYEITERIYKK